MMPPSAGPIIGAITATPTTATAARARSSRGKARNRIADPTGVSMPAPSPCRARKTTSCSSEPAAPHSADATVNTTRAMVNTFFDPNRSANHPAAGIPVASASR